MLCLFAFNVFLWQKKTLVQTKDSHEGSKDLEEARVVKGSERRFRNDVCHPLVLLECQRPFWDVGLLVIKFIITLFMFFKFFSRVLEGTEPRFGSFLSLETKLRKISGFFQIPPNLGENDGFFTVSRHDNSLNCDHLNNKQSELVREVFRGMEKMYCVEGIPWNFGL